MTYFIADNILAILIQSKEYKRGEDGWLAAIEIFRALAMRSEAQVLCNIFRWILLILNAAISLKFIIF